MPNTNLFGYGLRIGFTQTTSGNIYFASDMYQRNTYTRSRSVSSLGVPELCKYHHCGRPRFREEHFPKCVSKSNTHHLRVLIIEDTVESHASEHIGHLIQFKVDLFEKDVNNSSKSAEIIKLPHRSPDINLEEITTSEHSLSQ